MLKGSGGSKPAAGVLGTRKWIQLVLAQHPHNDICWHYHMSVRCSVIQPLGHPWALFIPTSRPHDPQLSQPLRPPWHMTKPVPFSKQQLWDIRWGCPRHFAFYIPLSPLHAGPGKLWALISFLVPARIYKGGQEARALSSQICGSLECIRPCHPSREFKGRVVRTTLSVLSPQIRRQAHRALGGWDKMAFFQIFCLRPELTMQSFCFLSSFLHEDTNLLRFEGGKGS